MEKVVIVPQEAMCEALWGQPFGAVLQVAEAKGFEVVELEINQFMSRAGNQPLRFQYLTSTPERGNHMAYRELTGFAVLRGDAKTHKTFLLGQGY